MSISWDDLIPLKQNKNTEYQPSQQEIIEYADYLGLELPQDQHYLYLVRQALKAPLPPFWQPCQTKQEQLYYRNKKTRQIMAQHPLDAFYKQKVAELKIIEANYGIMPINEQSALNQSSSIHQSKTRQSEMRTKQVQNQSRGFKLMEHHITQESVYSEQGSKQVKTNRMKASFKEKQPQWKIKHFFQLSKLRNKVQNYFPQNSELITYNSNVPFQNFTQESQEYKNLIQLRIQAKEKREKLQQLKQKRRQLADYYNELRFKTIK